jgi:predicted dehydrogenase
MVGLGSIGQRHVRNLKALLGDDVEVLAWRQRRRQHVLTDALTIQPGAQLDEFYGITTFDDLDSALNAGPDVVFVTNPNSLHVSVARAAARAGCHLFIEKPLSHTLDGIDELIDLMESQRLVAMVGFNMRFHPVLTFVKSLLDADAIGPLLAVRHEHGEYMPGWHPYEDYRELAGARRDQGGGVLLAQIHDLDMVFWLYGMPSQVFALGGHWTSLEIDVEDVASLLLECRHRGRALPVHVQQDFVRRPQVRRHEVIGERGTIVADCVENVVRVTDHDSGEVTVRSFDAFRRNDMFVDELKHFLACVRHEAAPPVGLREARESLRLALAAHHSIDTSTAVALSHTSA